MQNRRSQATSVEAETVAELDKKVWGGCYQNKPKCINDIAYNI